MYISNLDYIELPFEDCHYCDSNVVQGGIGINLATFAFAQGENTAITLSVARTAAVALSFGSFGL
jgi:hypothetical protein